MGWVIGILLIIVVGVFIFGSKGKGEIIVSDLNVKGDYTIDKPMILKGDSKISVEGNFTLSSSLNCDSGGLKIYVKGLTTIDGSLKCEGDEDSTGIIIVASGGLSMSPNTKVVSDGNIQIVSNENELLTSKEAIEQSFREIGEDSGAGQRIGPLVEEGATAVLKGKNNFGYVNTDFKGISLKEIFMPRMAEAQAPVPVVISGKMTVNTPPPGVRRLVILAFPEATEVKIQDFELSGPNGRKGTDDKNAKCTAEGGDGEDAFRFTAVAPNLTVNNFTLNLGNGGAGGDAETIKDCKPGVAKGGKGGSSGNFKMIGGASFNITGSFLINPGIGGAGGGAWAKGKDGVKAEDGGDATATAGLGAHNKKQLKAAGNISGTANVTVGDLIAGAGGSALAEPGKGGDGDGCTVAGGKGGKGVATGGAGGDAKLTLGGGAARAPLAKDIGGKGGIADVSGGAGGAGGDCDSKGPGGKGGDGGSASATEGKGGMGSAGRQIDGAVLDETGGAGGMGGDGCKEGKGGKGGVGDPVGANGSDGKNLCVTEEKKTQTDPGRKTIKAIEYNGKYLPVDQLIIESEIGCGADHYHAAEGVVKATDGSYVGDPGPQCGYGKVSEKPTRDVPVN